MCTVFIPCPSCGHEEIVYIAHIGAPGKGWHGKCEACGEDVQVVDQIPYAMSKLDGPIELTPEEVR